MKIIQFNEIYLQEMAHLYCSAYSEPGVWNDEKDAAKRLGFISSKTPDMCFVLLNEEDKCIGGILSYVEPYYDGLYLNIETLQIEPEHQGNGLAKKLLNHLLEKAKAKKLKGVHFLADNRKDFPITWYRKAGFRESGWIELEAKMNEIKL